MTHQILRLKRKHWCTCNLVPVDGRHTFSRFVAKHRQDSCEVGPEHPKQNNQNVSALLLKATTFDSTCFCFDKLAIIYKCLANLLNRNMITWEPSHNSIHPSPFHAVCMNDCCASCIYFVHCMNHSNFVLCQLCECPCVLLSVHII